MLGILSNDITGTSKDYILFRELNKLSETTQCFLFTNRIHRLPIKNKFAILQPIEALHHNGILISTTILTTQILANCLTATDKYCYLWFPEWSTLKNFGAHQLSRILYNDEIKLIARSKSYSKLLSKLFKKPYAIVDNWDADQIRSVIL